MTIIIAGIYILLVLINMVHMYVCAYLNIASKIAAPIMSPIKDESAVMSAIILYRNIITRTHTQHTCFIVAQLFDVDFYLFSMGLAEAIFSSFSLHWPNCISHDCYMWCSTRSE